MYKDILGKTDLFVLFKEVGLPTAGAYGLSEANHDLYYRELGKTNVGFVYFEGFDQPSKTNSSVEPHWGIFQSNRRPKLLGWNLMGYRLFASAGAYDGWVLECSEASGNGCIADSTATTLIVGNDSQNRQYRAFLSFNTAGLPDNAAITSVKLKVRSAGVVGANPFKKHQGLRADTCRPFFGIALGLQVTDFQAGANCSDVGIFRKTPSNGWYVLDFSPTSFSSINLKGTTQFRLRISGDDHDDMRISYVRFYSGNAADPNRPILVIEYHLP